MNYIEYKDSEGNQLAYYTITDSGIVRDLRSYLIPNMPDFVRSELEVSDYLTKAINAAEGLFIRRGGPLVISSGDVVPQTSYINQQGSIIIIMGFDGSDVKTVKVHYEDYDEDIAIDSASAMNKMVMLIISSADKIDPINVCYINDEQVMELKSKLSDSFYSIMTADKTSELPSEIFEDGKYLGYTIAKCIDDTLDLNASFNKRYRIDEI